MRKNSVLEKGEAKSNVNIIFQHKPTPNTFLASARLKSTPKKESLTQKYSDWAQPSLLW